MSVSIPETPLNVDGEFVLPHDYELCYFSGAGAFGRVYIVKDCANRLFALKMVSKSLLGLSWRKEFNGVRKFCEKHIDNEYLTRIYHVSENTEYFYYTMDCADNFKLRISGEYEPDTLSARLKLSPCTLEEIAVLTHNILSAMNALHQEGLIHADIKPSNIIYVRETPRLSDIGLVSSHLQSGVTGGTMGFLAPECKGTIAGVKNKVALDYYALGKIIYCALTGNSAEDYPEISLDILKTPQGKKLNKLIMHLCDPDPYKRWIKPQLVTQAMADILHTPSRSRSFFRKLVFPAALLLGIGLGGSALFAYNHLCADTPRSLTDYILYSPERVNPHQPAENTVERDLFYYVTGRPWQRTAHRYITFYQDGTMVEEFTARKEPPFEVRGTWWVNRERLHLDWNCDMTPAEDYVMPIKDRKLSSKTRNSAGDAPLYVIERID